MWGQYIGPTQDLVWGPCLGPTQDLVWGKPIGPTQDLVWDEYIGPIQDLVWGSVLDPHKILRGSNIFGLSFQRPWCSEAAERGSLSSLQEYCQT